MSEYKVVKPQEWEVKESDWHYIKDGEYPESEKTVWVVFYTTTHSKIDIENGYFRLYDVPLYYIFDEETENVGVDGKGAWWELVSDDVKDFCEPWEDREGREKQHHIFAWAYANLPDVVVPFRKFRDWLVDNGMLPVSDIKMAIDIRN